MLPTFPVSVKSPALSPPLSVTLVKDFISGHLNLVSAESLRKTEKRKKQASHLLKVLWTSTLSFITKCSRTCASLYSPPSTRKSIQFLMTPMLTTLLYLCYYVFLGSTILINAYSVQLPYLHVYKNNNNFI